MTKAVCYFGSFDPDYARNRIIKKGLVANGFKVYSSHASGLFPIRYYRLIKSFLKNRDKVSSIIVGFPGHYDIPLAFVLGKLFKKTVFYDIFASTYETYVLDRKVVNQNSLRAKFFFSLDRLGLILTDYAIADTKAHADFYKAFYNIKDKKFLVVYAGSDSQIFYPQKAQEDIDVLFYGSYQPLQGTEVIIKAARRLPKVKFRLIGQGQMKRQAENLSRKFKLENIEFVNWLSLGKLAKEISRAKITLGIFGDSQKAHLVIPNKVYDYLAFRKPVITASTSAIREVLDKNSVILVKPGDDAALAQAIAILLKDDAKRQKIAQNGYQLYISKLKPILVVDNLLLKLNE